MLKPLGYAIATTYFGITLSAGAAVASQWPASVVGTWKAFANQSPLVLDITNQGNIGACKSISGTIADVASGGQKNSIQGFYCPESGRITFLRKNVHTNDTFQVYSGNVSMSGDALRMGGIFAEENQANLLGEYNFSAQK